MASHDTEHRTRRSLSQDNSARIQNLNKELRKLKEGTRREELNKAGSKSDDGDTPDLKTKLP